MMYLNKIGANAYNGVLMAFQFVACLIMVKTDYIWGMIFSYALIIGGISNILYIMLRFHSYSALPGLCNMLIYIVTLSLLGHQFYIRDRESVTDYLKRTHFFEVLGLYLLVFFAFAFVIYRHETVFTTYGSALWYCFELVTTIGFGELVAVTRIGKVLSIILSIYSIGMIAIITSTVVTYHQVKLKTQENDAFVLFMDKLEKLPELDQEELKKISETIKQLRSNN